MRKVWRDVTSWKESSKTSWYSHIYGNKLFRAESSQSRLLSAYRINNLYNSLNLLDIDIFLNFVLIINGGQSESGPMHVQWLKEFLLLRREVPKKDQSIIIYFENKNINLGLFMLRNFHSMYCIQLSINKSW